MDEYKRTIIDLFYQTTKLYFEDNNIELKEAGFFNYNIAKYYVGAGVDDKYAMSHHTDYQQERVAISEYKFHTTVLYYLNDDYDGGRILFKILNETSDSIEFAVDYKPSAGDIVIFPSKHPFYHGVENTANAEKYFFRSY
jgi:predicted 2-oxoglutarate/Fe(II)-dependent dioxygenase YbiX